MALTERKPWPDPRYFAAAPTREQAKRIFWKDLKALVPRRWTARVYESELCIVTHLGSELWVVGLDRPERMEGTPWDGGVLDEYADMKADVWRSSVRPALSDRQGWCWFTGVPDGLNHFKDLADYARSSGDPLWGYYHWPSADILPAEEVAAARRDLDERTFRQEYEASFEVASGRVYYPFDRSLHVDDTVEIDARLPICLCCDFNVDPCVWELAQTDGAMVRVFDEVVLRGTSTMEMGREVLARYGGHAGGFRVYGDAAGSARSTTGATDYAILAELGFTDQRVARSNPAVKDRVNTLNAMLRSSSGEVRLRINGRCRMLVRDLETVCWNGDSMDLDKSERDRTHASDALGYFLCREFAPRRFRPDRGGRFYK